MLVGTIRAMHILVVHAQHRELGGEDVVADAEAALLRGAGHTVTEFRDQNPSGGAILASFGQAPWNVRAARAIGAAIRQTQPDVVHFHNTWFCLSPSVIHAAHRCNVPVVATLHNYRMLCAASTLFRDGQTCTDCIGGSSRPAVQHRCYRGSVPASIIAAATIRTTEFAGIAAKVDQFIAPTETIARIHRESGSIDSDSITVKAHFLEDPGVRSTPPSHSKTYVWAGRLAEGKGVELLLEAWRHAQQDSYRLLIVGDGPLRLQLERDAPAGVTFAGFRPLPETRAIIRDARAFLFPSVWLEPFGVVLIEALAGGTPVLGFNTGDTAAIIGLGGRVVANGDVQALSDLISRTADADLDRLSAAARQRYLDGYLPEANLTQLETIYANAIARRKQR